VVLEHCIPLSTRRRRKRKRRRRRKRELRLVVKSCFAHTPNETIDVPVAMPLDSGL